MNTSSRNQNNNPSCVPISSFSYRDISAPTPIAARETRPTELTIQQELQQKGLSALSVKEIEDLKMQARGEAAAETETRLTKEYQSKLEAECAKVREALELFQVERKDYYSRVESEIVHLAMAISAKILHREAQVDPLLVTALVRVAVDRLHDGSSVSVRVRPENAEKWRARLGIPHNGSTLTVVEDAHLGLDDCILETDLGSANFSIDAQLKEVEQGFFDLLAQRPQVK